MAELPQGTVTLVFTDIEGSTHLLETLGESYGEFLAEHQQAPAPGLFLPRWHRSRYPGGRLLLRLFPCHGRGGGGG
jgi:hypothetical protein